MKDIKKLTLKLIDFASKNKILKKKQKDIFIEFLRKFYSQNDLKDFNGSPLEVLHIHALSAFNTLCDRRRKEIKVKVFNPNIKDNGFDSVYSFIEITSEDMPFLVDSTVAYLDRMGIKIRNIIHPIYPVVRDSDFKIKAVDDFEKGESIIQLYITKINSEKTSKKLKKISRKS